MEIAISGATGFIGRRLSAALSGAGHSLRLLSRRAAPPLDWDPAAAEPRAGALAGCDAVIHLAGEPIAQRWTPEVKRRIEDSRLHGTRHLVQALSIQPVRPRVLVCASAVGVYGDRRDEVLTESSPPGDDYLAGVCRQWEQQADLAEALGLRVVKLRIGVVLGRGGGALDKMLPPFRYFAGGKLGSGRQWMSWIHLDDLVAMIGWSLASAVNGPVNAVAPNPVRNVEFTRALAGALRRPAVFTVPGFAVRLLYGEMSQVVLGSQRVLPKTATDAGFRFQYAELARALEAILAR
jgi:uncharacterized protein (TIGR01777 family)